MVESQINESMGRVFDKLDYTEPTDRRTAPNAVISGLSSESDDDSDSG